MVVEAYCDPPNFEEGAGETGARGEVREKVSDVGATRCGWVLVYFAFGVAVYVRPQGRARVRRVWDAAGREEGGPTR